MTVDKIEDAAAAIPLGLVGFPLKHSYSVEIVNALAEKSGLAGRVSYSLWDFSTEMEVRQWRREGPEVRGFNVTSPYKELLFDLCDRLHESAMYARAVNAVLVEGGAWTGYNTDISGFGTSLKNWIGKMPRRALILGSGGAARAVRAALDQLGVRSRMVSRTGGRADLTYEELTRSTIEDHLLVVHATPVGTWPEVNKSVNFPFHLLGRDHCLYDLVYNPGKSLFLVRGEEKGAKIKNGLEMLHLQAEHAWKIWMGQLHEY